MDTNELPQYLPSIRSGSSTDVGPKGCMEDEHICIDDLCAYFGPSFKCPTPSAFFGVFDGHGGSGSAAYMKMHATRFVFEESDFPQVSQPDEAFLQAVESSLRRAFRLADLALADDAAGQSSGTTALAALVLGRHLLVANAGDCRAVLCRKGSAVDMSQDHRPAVHAAEHRRVIDSGGFFDDGYLNGLISVTRALGDWEMKTPQGSSAPLLISEPELQKSVLTEDDEFLIIGCDGLWDVMSSQSAVSFVRRALRQHNDPEQCARDLIVEARRSQAVDNLTIIVILFSAGGGGGGSSAALEVTRVRGCKTLSVEAFSTLRSLLDGDEKGNA